jgi:hypothetical protein
MTLARAFPMTHRADMSQIKARDRSRHGRILRTTGSFIDFPVNGTYNPFIAGLYYTKVKLGSPAKEFNVHIDTGSDVSWVNCYECKGCPILTRLDIELKTYNPSESETANLIPCSDQRCELDYMSVCPNQNKQCMYRIVYGDGSKTEGGYVSDMIHFDTFVGDSSAKNISAPVIFGCTVSQKGAEKGEEADASVDGLIGLGQLPISIISQLAEQKLSPKTFSHCLKGNGDGGGILVLGQIQVPSMVYSPLVPSLPHYHLHLESISINGKKVAVDPDVYQPSIIKGTIIDSGTTLAYIASSAYDPFIKSIKEGIPKSVRSFSSKQFDYCFAMTLSVIETFPTVRFNFFGGALMNITPDEYLLRQGPYDVDELWCIGFTKSHDIFSILGDLVLKDKVIVYDIEGQQIGWANYNCSSPYNITMPKKRHIFDGLSYGDVSSSGNAFNKLRLTMLFVFALQLHFFNT